MKLFTHVLIVSLLAPTSALASPANLGDCDPNLRKKDEFHKYMCNRNDGSIGWLSGGRLGGGTPIFAVANRDTPDAFMVLKETNAYPGFRCYYDEPKGLNNPTSRCISQVSQMAAMPSYKVYANCSQIKVRYSNENSAYKFWELDEYRHMTWLPLGAQPSYVDGQPMRMAGGTDSIVTGAFATLCPAKFRSFGGKIGN
jgi:hypothetical protein